MSFCARHLLNTLTHPSEQHSTCSWDFGRARVQGKWAFADPKFINILRNDIGFDGSVMTDAWSERSLDGEALCDIEILWNPWRTVVVATLKGEVMGWWELSLIGSVNLYYIELYAAFLKSKVQMHDFLNPHHSNIGGISFGFVSKDITYLHSHLMMHEVAKSLRIGLHRGRRLLVAWSWVKLGRLALSTCRKVSFPATAPRWWPFWLFFWAVSHFKWGGLQWVAVLCEYLPIWIVEMPMFPCTKTSMASILRSFAVFVWIGNVMWRQRCKDWMTKRSPQGGTVWSNDLEPM